jgi:hypothetical protein
MLGLVFSLMLNCAPYLRKHKLSSLFTMFMILMRNRKEHRKGVLERSGEICSLH